MKPKIEDDKIKPKYFLFFIVKKFKKVCLKTTSSIIAGLKAKTNDGIAVKKKMGNFSYSFPAIT